MSINYKHWVSNHNNDQQVNSDSDAGHGSVPSVLKVIIRYFCADVEAAAHFDHWQRAQLDNLNVRQDLWPEALRNARVIPAVEYIQVGICCYP